MIRLRQIKNNCTEVQLDDVTLYFSYETIVGFHHHTIGTVLSENLWGTTTGRHLNLFGDKSLRIKREEFESQLNTILHNNNLSINFRG